MTQNKEFSDHYLGNDLKIDLSNVWFIYSLNYTHLINKTLLDRITIIKLDGYDDKQKVEICRKFLIPKALENAGLNLDDVKFSDKALNSLISKTNKLYDRDTKDEKGNTGVRKLKDAIIDIISKINFLRINKGIGMSFSVEDFSIPFTVKSSHIEKFYKDPKKDDMSYQKIYI